MFVFFYLRTIVSFQRATSVRMVGYRSLTVKDDEVYRSLEEHFVVTACLQAVCSGTVYALYLFNVFHVRALYYAKNINHQQMH
jgi:hypothetical protein